MGRHIPSRVGVLALSLAAGCSQGASSTPSPSQRTETTAATTPGSQQLSGQRPRAVAGLVPLGPLPGDQLVDVAIGLRLPNEQALDVLVRELYDPASPRFREFLTPREYTEKFAPSQQSYDAVLAFAARNDLALVATAPTRYDVHVRGTASAVNRAFHVALQRYQHPTEDRTFHAPDREPSVDLDVPLAFVLGLDDFRLPRRTSDHAAPTRTPGFAGGSGAGGTFTGFDARNAYAPGVSLNGAGQTVGILQLDGYLTSDIAAYEQASGFPNVPLQNVYLDGYTGPFTGSLGNQESTGDIEFVVSMAPGVSQVTIYGGPNDNAGYLDLLTEMANPTRGEPLPSQLSTSFYISYENGAVYPMLKQMAAQGQALFVASGDYGSYNETTGTYDFPPTDDPHVTAVGGTMLTTDANGAWQGETTWPFSGGGFSPWAGTDPEFQIPWWQAGMSFATFGGSSTARNVPDVSLVATNLLYFFNGGWTGFAGTSAAAPMWAGFMALVNQQAALVGQPPVGFANPALYAIGRGGTCPTCFHDITTGNNFNDVNPSKYSAVPGYDLCTGWGTPNGQPLIDALVSYGNHPAVGGAPIVGVKRIDFNGDGRADLLSANGNFDEWLGQSDGSLAWSPAPAPSFCQNDAEACISTLANHVIVGDFNGDGRTDFLSANGNFDTWLANQDGSFTWTAAAAPAWCAGGAKGCLSGAPGHVIAGDFDGDGRTDFLSVNTNFDVWLSNGDGTFRWVAAPPPSWCPNASQCVSSTPGLVIVGDFNGDGRTDFLSANGNFDTWIARGDGTFGWTSTAAPTWCGGHASACMSTAAGHVLVGDFNGDGQTDFASANGNFDTWLAKPDHSGTFSYRGTAPPSWCYHGATGCLSTAPAHVLVGDFNGDGRADFVSANGNFDTWLGNWDGSFTYTGSAPPSWCPGGATGCLSGTPNHVVVGDFNGDGRTDFTSANGGFDTWLGGNGGKLTWSPSAAPSWCTQGAYGCVQTLANHVIVSK